jgi:hypothetical protein
VTTAQDRKPRRLAQPTAAIAARLSRPRDRYTVMYFGLLLFYLATAQYTWQSIDTISMYYPAWQLAHHGNLTLDAFANSHNPFISEVNGRFVSNRLPGAMWLATPLYLLDRSPSPTPLMGNLTAAAVTAGTVTILFALLCRLVSTRTALLGALLVAFGTPTWTVSGHALWTHSPGTFWMLLAVLLLVHERPALAGAAFFAAVVTRPHYAAVAAVIGVIDLVVRRRLKPCLFLGIGSALGLVALTLYSKAAYGVANPLGAYRGHTVVTQGGPTTSYVENLAGVLFSPSRGIFVLTPFLLLLLPGLVGGWRRAPLWARSAALGGTAYLLLQTRVNGFSGGYSFFSYRLALEWLTLSGPLLALAYDAWTARAAWRRWGFGILAVYSVATHAVGALLYRPEATEPDYWRTWSVGVTFAHRPAASVALAVLATIAALLVWRSASLAAERPVTTATSAA